MSKNALNNPLAQRRLAYVAVIKRSCVDLNELRVAISEVARQRKEFPAPSIATVCRWQRLINSDGELPFLISQKKRQGVRRSKKQRICED